MRRVCFCTAILILSAVAANAAPKAELFGGYQFTHLDGGPNMNGWNGALTGNFNPWFGVTAGFSGVYGSGLSFHTYTFGPEVHSPAPGETLRPRFVWRCQGISGWRGDEWI